MIYGFLRSRLVIGLIMGGAALAVQSTAMGDASTGAVPKGEAVAIRLERRGVAAGAGLSAFAE